MSTQHKYEVTPRCPRCTSTNVGHYDGINTEVTYLWQRGRCNECRATWVEIFKLDRFEDVFVPGDGFDPDEMIGV